MIRILMKGDYSVAEMVDSLKASQADVYRRVKQVQEEIRQTSEEDRRWISHWMQRHFAWEPRPLHEWRERRRRNCWKRAKRVSG